MRTMFILLAAGGLAVSGPALADPGGHGHGNGHGNPHDYGYNGPVGYGHGGCPPGLRNKGCMPPGQARKLARGQRWQNTYGSAYSYGRIPLSVRRQYDLNARYRYYYNNGYLYQVDPRTMLVSQVINALLR